MIGTKTSVAINFSDFSLEVIELIKVKGFYSIKSQNRLLIDEGIIVDGKIIKKDQVKAAIRKLFQTAKPAAITSKEIAITIPESRVFTQTLLLPRSLDKKQLPSAIFSRAKESIPLETNEIASDYQVIGHDKENNQVMFAATYKSLIQEYKEIFEDLGLRLTVISMESLAYAAATIDEKSDRTILALDIGSRTTIASIFHYGQLKDSININIAGNNITMALAERMKVSLKEAEQVKIQTGLQSEGNDGSTMLVIQGQLQPLKDELALYLKYYEAQKGTKVDAIMLAGGTASLVGLDAYLANNLEITVDIAKPLPIFKIGTQQTLPKFIIALGMAYLALERPPQLLNFFEHKDMQPKSSKNLIKSRRSSSSDVQPTKKQRGKILIYLVLLLLVAIGFVYLLKIKGYLRLPSIHFGAPAALTLPHVDTGNVKSGDINVVVRTIDGRSVTGTEHVSFTFVVAMTKDTSQVGDFLGKLESIAIVEERSYDESTINLVRQNLIEKGFLDPPSEQLKEALQDYLITSMWLDHYPENSSKRLENNQQLLTDYYDKSVTVYDPVITADTESGIETVAIDVNFIAVVLEGSESLSPLENGLADLIAKKDEQWDFIDKHYTYEELPNDRYRVVAVYTLRPQ